MKDLKKISFNAEIIEQRELSPDIFKITLSPLSPIIEPEPGQFFMLSVSEGYDPLLKRPLSIYNYSPERLEFLYRIRGRGTAILSKKREGQVLSVTGPFGRPYPEPGRVEGEILIIAGGMGIASLNYLIKKFLKGPYNLRLLFGARTGEELSCLSPDIRDIPLWISTEDGSGGSYGTVIDLLKEYLSESIPAVIYACGPRPVLKAVDEMAVKRGIKAYLSVEERMACGMGVCLGCVVMTKEGYKRVCREGPVFESGEILW